MEGKGGGRWRAGGAAESFCALGWRQIMHTLFGARLGRELQWQCKFFGRYKKEMRERGGGGEKEREREERKGVSQHR